MVIINHLRKLAAGTPTANQKVHLWDLPPELVLEILRYLGHRELLKLARVCKWLQEFTMSWLELQYPIELAADGMVDVPSCGLSVADRYNLLLDRRRRWRTLDWVGQTPLSVPGSCQAYELVGGVFAKTSSAPFVFGSRQFSATFLPTRDTPARGIEREDLGMATRDFAIDPSQDLVAFVEAQEGHPITSRMKVHLRTLSDNSPHPRARVKELSVAMQFGVGSSFIQIVDDVVGMFYWIDGPGILVWNWLTGDLLVQVALPDLPLNTWDFAFLSSRAFMTAVTGGNGAIRVYAFAGTPTTHGKPRWVAQLHMPALKGGHELQACTTHSGPFVARTLPGQPFAVAPETRVHLMLLTYGELLPRLHMFVHNEFLLSLVPEDVDFEGQEIVKHHLWTKWGPARTRVFEHSMQFQWLRYAHGARVILPPRAVRSAEGSGPLCQLRVLDFNVHPKRTNEPADGAAAGEHGGAFRIVDEASTVGAKGVFEQDIVTRLAYGESTRTIPYVYEGFMMDDERLLGVKSQGAAAGSHMSELDVFAF